MLKKKSFSLLLSAAICTTSPLFAMDLPEDDQGRGTLCKLSSELCPVVLGHLSDEDIVEATSRLSRTSKGMCAFINQPFIWHPLSIRLCTQFTVNPQSSGQDKVKEFFSSFNGPTPKISIAQLELFKREPYPDPKYSVSFCFSLGKKKYQMFNPFHSYPKIGSGKLELLDRDAIVTFAPLDYPRNPKNSFIAAFSVCSLSAGIKDLSSAEYQSITKNAFMNRDVNYTGDNSFIITKLEPKVEKVAEELKPE